MPWLPTHLVQEWIVSTVHGSSLHFHLSIIIASYLHVYSWKIMQYCNNLWPRGPNKDNAFYYVNNASLMIQLIHSHFVDNAVSFPTKYTDIVLEIQRAFFLVYIFFKWCLCQGWYWVGLLICIGGVTEIRYEMGLCIYVLNFKRHVYYVWMNYNCLFYLNYLFPRPWPFLLIFNHDDLGILRVQSFRQFKDNWWLKVGY